LKSPLEGSVLERFLELLSGPPGELVRKDKNFKELGLDEGGYTTPQAVIALLLEHPKLMQRPVAVLGGRAVIARPSERVLELLDG